MEITLNLETFKTYSTGKVPILVDFWASWCGPCKMLAPVFEAVSEEYSDDKLLFGKVSTEEFPQIAQANRVTGIPCLIMFKGGKEVGRIVGFMPQHVLKQKIDEILAKL